MRYPAVRREETRKQILEVAAARFRRDGLNAVGIKSIMADAGLTHGGFYAHFPNREGLVADAVAASFEDTGRRLRNFVATGPFEMGLQTLVRGYLSAAHRDGFEWGCAAAALAPEIARESDPARAAFTAGVGGIVKLVAELLPSGGTNRERLDRAYVLFSLMMGSLQVARTVNNAALSKRLLSDAQASVLELAKRPWGERSS